MSIRNYSGRTIATYCSLMRLFLGQRKKLLKEITPEDLKDYLYKRIKQDNISASTVNQTISAWKIVQVYLLGRQWESFRIVRPRKNRALPEVLSQPEAQKLVHAPSNLKHRTILSLLYSTGIRRGELLGLVPADVDSSRMIITIRQGKGHKDRQVVLTTGLLALLRKYYQHYRPQARLFEGYPKGTPLSATSLANVVKSGAQKAGIKKKVSAHTLRHCFATHMLERGVNLKIIQQLMGHSSIKTTSMYLSLANMDNSMLPNLLESIS